MTSAVSAAEETTPKASTSVKTSIVTVGLDDQIQRLDGPEWPKGYQLDGQKTAPVVILDVGKGMKGGSGQMRDDVLER